MSFDEYADVPEKMYVFYEEAFAVLAKKHDATKSLYTRQYASGLSTADIRKLFGAFSFFSYAEEGPSIGQNKVGDYIDKAIKYYHSSSEQSALLTDFEKSICILLREGDHYVFIHRSFQEYFSALFLTKLPPEFGRKVLPKLASSAKTESVIRLALEIDQDYVERNYIYPMLKSLLNEADQIDLTSEPQKFAELFFSGVGEHTFVRGDSIHRAAKTKGAGPHEKGPLFFVGKHNQFHRYFSVMYLCRIFYRRGLFGMLQFEFGDESDRASNARSASYINRRPHIKNALRAIDRDLREIFHEVERRISERSDLIGDILEQATPKRLVRPAQRS